MVDWSSLPLLSFEGDLVLTTSAKLLSDTEQILEKSEIDVIENKDITGDRDLEARRGIESASSCPYPTLAFEQRVVGQTLFVRNVSFPLAVLLVL